MKTRFWKEKSKISQITEIITGIFQNHTLNIKMSLTLNIIPAIISRAPCQLYLYKRRKHHQYLQQYMYSIYKPKIDLVTDTCINNSKYITTYQSSHMVNIRDSNIRGGNTHTCNKNSISGGSIKVPTPDPQTARPVANARFFSK